MARHRLLIKLAARCTTAPVLPANIDIFLERLRLMIPPPIKCDALINLPGIHQVGVFAQDVVTFHRNCRFPELGYLFNMAERAPDSKKNNTSWSLLQNVSGRQEGPNEKIEPTHSYSRHYDGEALRHVFNSSIHLKVVSATGCCLQIEQSASLGRFWFILIKCNFLQPLGHSHGGRSHSKVALPESQFCDVRLWKHREINSMALAIT